VTDKSKSPLLVVGRYTLLFVYTVYSEFILDTLRRQVSEECSFCLKCTNTKRSMIFAEQGELQKSNCGWFYC
jgi:hypothetical protein